MLRVLYQSEKTGMVGPVSNYVSGAQMIHDAYQSLDELESFAEAYCEREKHHTKRVLRLVGFCLLVKRSVIEDIGPFDEQFGYGSFEDDDLCLRALQKATACTSPSMPLCITTGTRRLRLIRISISISYIRRTASVLRKNGALILRTLLIRDRKLRSSFPGRRNGYLMSAAARGLRGWNFKTDSLANCTE